MQNIKKKIELFIKLKWKHLSMRQVGDYDTVEIA